jgi:hypothetical protein
LNEKLKDEEFNTAILYSISSTQPGLNGVNLGNLLIKNVVEQLKKESKLIFFYHEILLYFQLSPQSLDS